MTSPYIRTMEKNDAPMISEAFMAIGWNNPVSLYNRYFEEQSAGARIVYLAFVDSDGSAEVPGAQKTAGAQSEPSGTETPMNFTGYVTIVWESDYPPFRDRGIPEIKDFAMLPEFRRKGIGSALLDKAEATIRTRSAVAGIGVGLYPDYCPAHILYIKRGYIPDGRGLYTGDHWAAAMEMVRVDDSLTIQFEKALS